MTALLLAFVVSQAPPGTTPKPMTEDQRCVQECGKKILDCQMPCAPKSPEDADKPEKRKAFMACSQDCARKNMPCIDACKKKDKKGKEKDPTE